LYRIAIVIFARKLHFMPRTRKVFFLSSRTWFRSYKN